MAINKYKYLEEAVEQLKPIIAPYVGKTMFCRKYRVLLQIVEPKLTIYYNNPYILYAVDNIDNLENIFAISKFYKDFEGYYKPNIDFKYIQHTVITNILNIDFNDPLAKALYSRI